MNRGFAFLIGFCVGLLLSIAYDTSAQVSVLEGGRSHLTFGAVLLIAVVGGIVGAAIEEGRARRRRG